MPAKVYFVPLGLIVYRHSLDDADFNETTN